LEILISDIELLLLERVPNPLPLLLEAPEVVPNPEFWVLFVFPNPRVVEGCVVFVVEALVLAVVVVVVALKPPKVKDGVEVIAVVVVAVAVAAAAVVVVLVVVRDGAKLTEGAVVAGFAAPKVKVFVVVLVLGVVVEAVVVVV